MHLNIGLNNELANMGMDCKGSLNKKKLFAHLFRVSGAFTGSCDNYS